MTARDLPGLLETALGLPALAPEARALRLLAEDAERMAELGGRPLRVALLGSTGAGKSTLLNALAGAALAEEGTERPTSREAVAYAPEGVALGPLEDAVGRVARYPILPRSPWSGQVFVDTPDLNSVVAGHAARALAVLAYADVALLVMHRGSVAEARPVEALRPFARRRALLLVLNHADQLGAEARATLAAQAARVAVDELGAPDAPPVFVVSAARAREGVAFPDDWEALLTELRRLARATVATEIRGRNRAGLMAEVQERVAAALRSTDELEGVVRAALEEGLAETRGALVEDFTARLEAASGQLRAAVRRAAAARLSGPVAWFLRMSAWSGGGLLGGALLARASLPAGLLLAATGAALDEVQARTRARATRQAMSGGEDPVLEAQARAALTRARTATLRSGVEPEALALPEPEAWAATVAHARAAAWGDVEGFAVDGAVARWWRWARLLLIPLVQLPLLLLLGDVAWRTVRAYLFGPLLDVGFYVNAGALAVVWTTAGALLTGLSLAGVAAQVRRSGARRFADGLAAAESSLRARVAGALAVPRAAAAALLGASPGPDP